MWLGHHVKRSKVKVTGGGGILWRLSYSLLTLYASTVADWAKSIDSNYLLFLKKQNAQVSTAKRAEPGSIGLKTVNVVASGRFAAPLPHGSAVLGSRQVRRMIKVRPLPCPRWLRASGITGENTQPHTQLMQRMRHGAVPLSWIYTE